MRRFPPRDRQATLFGDADRRSHSKRTVEVTLIAFDDAETPLAWLVGESEARADAKWLPKSLATRGEGRDANVWTMPEWVAIDRRWV